MIGGFVQNSIRTYGGRWPIHFYRQPVVGQWVAKEHAPKKKKNSTTFLERSCIPSFVLVARPANQPTSQPASRPFSVSPLPTAKGIGAKPPAKAAAVAVSSRRSKVVFPRQSRVTSRIEGEPLSRPRQPFRWSQTGVGKNYAIHLESPSALPCIACPHLPAPQHPAQPVSRRAATLMSSVLVAKGQPRPARRACATRGQRWHFNKPTPSSSLAATDVVAWLSSDSR